MKNIYKYLLTLLVVLFLGLADSHLLDKKDSDMKVSKLHIPTLEIDLKTRNLFETQYNEFIFDLRLIKNIIMTRYARDNENSEILIASIYAIYSDRSYTQDLILSLVSKDPSFITFESSDTNYKNHSQSNKLSILLVFLSLTSIMVVIYLIFSFKGTIKKSQELRKQIAKLDSKTIKHDEVTSNSAYLIIKNRKTIDQEILRKKLSCSKERLSVIIDELEIQGKVKKVKSGKSIVIVFVQ